MLVSPGIEITVTDESQYVSTAVGTVPFVLLATAQDKLFNDVIAPYTTKANAGKLLAVTSQRDLITNFGYPDFKLSSAGTPLHGDELNEYGLMAAYSSLGVCNRMYIIRADVDLNQLIGTTVRPIGEPADQVQWLDLSTTAWGIYEWNAITQEFVNRVPLVITDILSTTSVLGVSYPNASIGSIGSYAVVVCNPSDYTGNPVNFMFYKRRDNVWTQIGTTEWQGAFPAVSGTVSNPAISGGSTININTQIRSIAGPGLASVVTAINTPAIPGVTAAIVDNKIAIYVTSASMSNGVLADGKVAIVDGANTPAATMGLALGYHAAPAVEYGGYVQVPDWRTSDTTPRPTGSVWAKTSVLGSGANLAFNIYDAENNVWTPETAPIYATEAAAIYALDPLTGGMAIQYGTLYVQQDALGDGTVSYRAFMRNTQGALEVTGSTIGTMTFNATDTFTISTTEAGVDVSYPVTFTGAGPYDAAWFVSRVSAASIPYVVASVEISGAITFTHTQGGTITLTDGTGTPLAIAGFNSATTGVRLLNIAGPELVLSNFTPLVYTYSLTQPYTAPADGTLWYYDSPLEVDIMVNETTGWKGYRTVSNDARGYNLVSTDAEGPILSPSIPTTQANNNALVPGDLWVNTGDLENFPVISRWTGAKWQLLDNTDVINQNGIVFADARWDTDGTTDPAAGDFTPISSMLLSNYIDLDCPDHRLYPRGTLLFNLRRSGFNVKQYISDYFNAQSYPDDTLPTVSAAWVTTSGLQESGAPYMGHKAQRVMITKGLKAAIDGSDTLREEAFQFNLIVTPGYPEVISNMVMLNNDRKDTAFVIGDTPMSLAANTMDILAWSTNSSGTGLSTADPYLGVYYPSGLTNDLQGNTIVVPPSHMILRAAIKSDNVSYPWFAYAGTRRGLIDNAVDIGYVNMSTGSFIRNGINQGLRDTLYQTNINPITLLPGVGITNFGNKTRNGVASAMDRVNVSRLINYIRTILAHIGDGYLFEPNDAITRSQIRQVISSAINDLIVKRGIYDYLVVCDETNNTNDRIARNELYVDIAIEPMKDVEFIYIPIRLKNPGGIKATGK